MISRIYRHEMPVENIAGPCLDKPAEIRCAACIMDTSFYFSGLSIEAKRELQQFLQLKRFNKKEVLYKAGDECNNVYILLSGEVKIYKSLLSGKQQIHKLAQIPGDMIPCEDLFLDTHGSSAEALSDVSMCYLKRQDLLNTTDRHSEIAICLMRAMSRNLNAYIQHITNLGQKSALERVASYLVFLHETHHERNLNKGCLHEALSRVELADMLGVTQRTLIRSLKKLETERLVNMKRDAFIILDIDTLQQISLGD